MGEFGELFKSDDWKKEKHVPVIEVSGKAGKGEVCRVNVSVGKEIPHPNTTQHHIRWIEVYFLPEGGHFPYQIGKFTFTSHGESTEGPDTSAVYTHPEVSFSFRTENPGVLFAASYCNIHGLWESRAKIG